MKAIVLVGGEGTRLRPLTFTTPKQMLPIVECPMLERVLAHLRLHGVDHVVLSLGYRPDVFLKSYPDGEAVGVSLSYAVEREPLDTAGAIRFAATHLGIDGTFLALNGDVLTDVDVSELVEFHRRRRAEATISLTPVEDPSAFGVVVTDGDGRVEAFVEKPPPEDAPTNLINAGIYVLEPSVLDAIEPGRRVSIERATFPAMAEEGRLFACPSTEYWLDTGTPEAYLQAQHDLLSGRRSGPPAPGARQVSSGFWVIGDPVIEGEVLPGSLIGDRAVVAAGACVVGSVVGSGARVDEDARIQGSAMLPGSVVGARSSISDSVLGGGAVVGEDTTIAQVSVIGFGAKVRPGENLSAARLPEALQAAEPGGQQA